MRKGNHSKSRASKGLVLMLALVLLVGVAVGGTVAWLTAKTDAVVNTFTASGIKISLTEEAGETAKQFQMIPGQDITKDPKVAVDSSTNVDCYLFVKIEESENFGTFFDEDAYAVATGWTQVTDEDNVYWREVKTTDSTKAFYVLADNTVTVSSSVEQSHMEGLTANTYPTLTFTAYAVQTLGFDDADDAWLEAKKLG